MMISPFRYSTRSVSCSATANRKSWWLFCGSVSWRSGAVAMLELLGARVLIDRSPLAFEPLVYDPLASYVASPHFVARLTPRGYAQSFPPGHRAAGGSSNLL